VTWTDLTKKGSNILILVKKKKERERTQFRISHDYYGEENCLMGRNSRFLGGCNI